MATPAPTPAPEPQKAMDEATSQMQNLTTGSDGDDIPQLGGCLISDEKSELVIEKSHAMDAIYTSASTWEDLKLAPELLQGVQALNYQKPSKIQATALPIILGNPVSNLIAQAQAGTGKTATFTIGMLGRCDPNLHEPQVIVVSPTRELARQTHDVVRALGRFTRLEILLAIPDAELPKKATQQVIIGTPGKLEDLIRRRVINTRTIRVLVFDEADEMMDQQGFRGQSTSIKNALPRSCQVLFLSATFTDEVMRFIQQVVPQPYVMLRLKAEEVALDRISQFFINCGSAENKFKVLSDLYGFLNVGQSIIFVNERSTAQDLYKKMTAAGFVVSLLHGTGADMTTKERDRVIDEFRKGTTRVLITTNVLSRGIDVLTVTLVINYDIPVRPNGKPDPQTYIHRVGRTARFGRFGMAINFLHDEKSRAALQEIIREIQRDVKEFYTKDFEQLPKLLRELN